MTGWQIALLAVGVIGGIVAFARGKSKLTVTHGEEVEKGFNLSVTTKGSTDDEGGD